MEFSSILNASNYNDLNLCECGREKCIANKQFEYTVKQYHLIHYILSGKGYFEINGQKYALNMGELFYIPPRCSAHYYPDVDTPWSYCWLGFDGAMAPSFIAACGLSSQTPVFNDSYGQLRGYFYNIWDRFQQVGYLDVKCLGLTYEMLAQFNEIANIKSSILPSRESYVNVAKAFIWHNYQFDIKITDVADSVGLNPNYLSNIFTEVEGISPKKYLTRLRMQKACDMLRSGQSKVKDIAKKVGYDNQLHFSAEFKKAVAVSPTTYLHSLKDDK